MRQQGSRFRCYLGWTCMKFRGVRCRYAAFQLSGRKTNRRYPNWRVVLPLAGTAQAQSACLPLTSWLVTGTYEPHRGGGGGPSTTPLDDSTTKWHHAKALRPLADMLGHRAFGVSVGCRVGLQPPAGRGRWRINLMFKILARCQPCLLGWLACIYSINEHYWSCLLLLDCWILSASFL